MSLREECKTCVCPKIKILDNVHFMVDTFISIGFEITIESFSLLSVSPAS